MVYYSGTSEKSYHTQQAIDEKFPGMINDIYCWSSTSLGVNAFLLAINFAKKRARQDFSSPLVIEITEPGEFKLRKECNPVLEGRLTESNHRIHEVE